MAIPRSSSVRAKIINERLGKLFPGSTKTLCALEHKNPFELIAATILSAQCTDERVNMVTPALFKKYPTPDKLRKASPIEVEEIIHSTGFFRAKAKNLILMADKVVTDFDGEIPNTMDELTRLPGVGRKTANVVLSVAFALPGLPVDTHVLRLSKRMGLSISGDPIKVEADLNKVIPPDERGAFSIRMILHGRKTCSSRSPKCPECDLSDICPKIGLSRE
ncbi:MAG: endonuclease III [Acidimicrobiales bacterium]|nr:endonuclease III [Acidimicrobiales bacterium]